MLKTLRISWDIQQTYLVNSILYSLKQTPILKRLLPAYPYRVHGLKVFAGGISMIWNILKLFGGKALYFVIFLGWAGGLTPSFPAEEVYLYRLLLLTVIGMLINTSFAEPSYQRYYAVTLLRMNAKNYTLSHFWAGMVKNLVGFLPFSLLFGSGNGVPLWINLLIPLCIVGGKTAEMALELWYFDRRNGAVKERNMVRWCVSTVILAAAYGLPMAGYILPGEVSLGLLLAMISLGLIGIPKILRFNSYRQLNQRVLAQFFDGMDAVTHQAQTNTHHLISESSQITSHKQGFEYLNDLFVKRHRRLLWKATWIISGVCGVLVLAGSVGLMLFPAVHPKVQFVILNTLPFWSFILYFMNRGTSFTRALFINCDHSLLTYSFYKQPKTVLTLFRIRLREICKVNAVPALIIGLGLDVLLLLAGGGTWAEYLVIPVTILSMSLFFSIHYLTLYYLLQPFNAGTEIKSGTYQILTGGTYFVCYLLMKAELPTMLFGLMCIVFCLLYSIIACALVYRFAPKTFRIRQ